LILNTLFGIPNCDTIKKAKKWLNESNVDYSFHDYRKDGISEAWINEAEQALGWENMLNKRGTTYRQLSDEQKANIDQNSALKLMLEAPAMIKRPILVADGKYTVGFSVDTYQQVFS
jgi:Spx/MgsR family transcriptional regulator